MNTRWNYILKETEDRRIIFRIYPSSTCIHSFNNTRPQTWKEVYKVYYSWAIIQQYKNDEGIVEPESSERLIYMYCDECSEIVNLHNIIKWVIKEQKEYDYPTLGQPAGDWIINVHKGGDEEKGIDPYEYYSFYVFDNWNNNGYRFSLDRAETEQFAQWLEEMNERALIRCGCPI